MRFVAAAMAAGGTAVAGAEPLDPIRLEYTAPAEGCPDRVAFESAVAAELGYPPFAVDARRQVTVRIERQGASLVAGVRFHDEAGQPVGEKQIPTTGACERLVEVIALTVAVALDPGQEGRNAESIVTPVEALARSEARPVEPARQEAPAPGNAAPVAAPAVRLDPWAFSTGVGFVTTLLAAPAPGLGFELLGRARHGRFSSSLEGRVDLESTAPASGGRVASSLLVAGLSACGHAEAVALCGLAFGGVVRASGEGFGRDLRVTGPWAAAGARVSGEWPVHGRLGLRVHADVLAPLVRSVLTVDGEAVWTTPPVSLAAGADVILELP